MAQLALLMDGQAFCKPMVGKVSDYLLIQLAYLDKTSSLLILSSLSQWYLPLCVNMCPLLLPDPV
jgi:hypothetical protein